MAKDLYEVLEVSKTATDDEIKNVINLKMKIPNNVGATCGRLM